MNNTFMTLENAAMLTAILRMFASALNDEVKFENNCLYYMYAICPNLIQAIWMLLEEY